MAWSRGLFRIWIVLSILWLVAAGALLWKPVFGGGTPLFEEWYRFSWEEKAVQLGPLDKEFQDYVSLGQPLPAGIIWTTLSSNDFAFHLMHAEGIAPADLEASLAAVQADLDKLQSSQDSSRRQAMPLFAGILLAPPLVLLLIGWVIGWVARGFRSSQSR